LGFDEVNGGGSLNPEHSLASVQLGHLKGYMLISKLIMVLSCPPLDVDLSGMGSCLLLLLVSLLLIEEEFHSWLGYCHLHHDRHDGLVSRSALRSWCDDDEVSQGHHVASSVVEGSKASPSV
jgi:hypothetical protein